MILCKCAHTELPVGSQTTDRFQFNRLLIHAGRCQTCVVVLFTALGIEFYPGLARRIDFSEFDPKID